MRLSRGFVTALLNNRRVIYTMCPVYNIGVTIT
nr:MAG TPA: hypothetical protein [Caudoviricetes sp.]